MANSISVDTRKRAVKRYMTTKRSLRQVAVEYDITANTLHKWVKQFRTTQSLEPKPDSGGKAHQKLFAQHHQWMLERMEDFPALFMHELAQDVHDEFGIKVTPQHLGQLLKDLGWTRKKSR